MPGSVQSWITQRRVLEAAKTLSVQKAAATGMRVAPESLMRPAASPSGHASCASSAYHCGFVSLAAALAANTAASPAPDHRVNADSTMHTKLKTAPSPCSHASAHAH